MKEVETAKTTIEKVEGWLKYVRHSIDLRARRLATVSRIALAVVLLLTIIRLAFAGEVDLISSFPRTGPLEESTISLLKRVGSAICRITVMKGGYYEEWIKLFQQYEEVGANKFKLATRQHILMSHSS